ncbi:NAD-dependent succinate-semialdehyde dehydrogenase [Henriciella barbarensis]|uniref:NAD-dependent succinate-semialdehyde dehydrogenase n=1 Tax=Henriciella barbarensis TaxID=86342 RepID=A0A399QXV2_9PROT|nr:NAD-dependent succinate-semialdehyde dehydrogenase [Henriciella barbarensis]RIJ22139.1 NAD-dependent succinate-semialdehyde dehydrogenase [Henriciella barbarensis]
MSVSSINPATEEVIETFETHSQVDVDAALAKADERYADWRLTSFNDRAKLMEKAAQVLESRVEDWAPAMSREMGKPLAQAEGELKKCAWVCRHYAANAESYLKDETIKTDASQSFVRHLPVGPVLAVMPWNFPYWQVFRFAAPALMAGNVGLLKHASNVWRCALNIEDVFREAGFPDGCFQTLLIGSDGVENVLRDRRVRAATLTGSGPAGASVASISGDEIKPTVLELGGTDAFIIMPSADIESAVETAIDARVQNNGQSCIAAKRFFAHEDIYNEFRDRFVEGMKALKIGDPLADETNIGPLAMKSLRDDLAEQVARSVAAGARPLLEASPLPDKGWWYGPQILEDAPDAAPAAHEEMFGPVASLWKVSSLSQAIERANNSPFGLGSSICTTEKREIETAIRDLDAGSTFVNSKVASDPRLPFGGVKSSGYGRELAADGIKAFINRKTVSIA